eukprot:SAG31_NODE_7011_length_1818_cov_1.697499_2_plen_503_part_00
MTTQRTKMLQLVQPTRLLQVAFGCWTTTALMWHSAELLRFYDRWCKSGISMTARRGLGSGPCKLYGILPVPALTPVQLRAAMLVLGCGLLGCCTPLCPRAAASLAFVSYHLVFPQLFASRIVGGHVSILLPAVLVQLACCPQDRVWGILLLRVHVASCYCSSGMSKLWSSVKVGLFWGRAETLQYYILESRWMRRHGEYSSLVAPALQRLVLQQPAVLLKAMASTALLIEAGAPLAVLGGDTAAALFGLAAFGFHVGVALLQELDFISFWVPGLFAFVIPIGSSGIDTWQLILTGKEDLLFGLALLYTTMQLLCALTHHDGSLPLSCVPMFQLPRRLDDSLPKTAIITPYPNNRISDEPRTPEPYYWDPTSEDGMTATDLKLLWRPLLWFGFVGPQRDDRQFAELFWRESVSKEWVKKGHYVVSNFERSKSLDHAIDGVLDLLVAAQNDVPKDLDAMDRRHAKILAKAMVLQDRCLAEFDKCVEMIENPACSICSKCFSDTN